MKIAHIINPVLVDEERDLFFQQPITFRTMEIARDFAKTQGIEVDLFTTCYPEDEAICPDWIKTPNLERSTLGLGYSPARKLPYFKDILDRLYENTDADVLIQTNADIGVQPYLYSLVAKLVQDGSEAFVVTKRILPEVDMFKNVDAIPIMWATWGGPHNGHDCFVFKRSLYPKFIIGDIVMGTPWSEATLLFSMVAYGKGFAEFKNAHATFHIGDRRIWLPVSHNDYRIHNTNEVGKALRVLTKKFPKMYKNATIQTYINKIKVEVLGYKDPRYNKDCNYFARK